MAQRLSEGGQQEQEHDAGERCVGITRAGRVVKSENRPQRHPRPCARANLGERHWHRHTPTATRCVALVTTQAANTSRLLTSASPLDVDTQSVSAFVRIADIRLSETSRTLTPLAPHLHHSCSHPSNLLAVSRLLLLQAHPVPIADTRLSSPSSSQPPAASPPSHPAPTPLAVPCRAP